MIAEAEFEYIRAVVSGALSKGTPIGEGMAVVDVEAVLAALDGCRGALRLPPAPREGDGEGEGPTHAL